MVSSAANTRMAIALLLTSIAQLAAICADQYVLNIDFKMQRQQQELIEVSSVRNDYNNAHNILFTLFRHREGAELDNFMISNKQSAKEALSSNASFLEFALEELALMINAHQSGNVSPTLLANVQNSVDQDLNQQIINMISELEKKLDHLYQKSSSLKLQISESQNLRHLVVLLAVVFQIISLLSLLFYFIFEMYFRKRPS